MAFLPLLPPEQNELLFGPQEEPCPRPARYRIPLIEDELKRLYGPVVKGFEETRTWLPNLGGPPVEWAERTFGDRYAQQLAGLDKLARSAPVPPPIHPVLRSGWTRYENGTGRVTQVPYPTEDVLLFDTETFVKGGGHPVMGMAASPEAWYVWMAPAVGDDRIDQRPTELIPLGPNKTFIAHNAMFDQSKVAEAYSMANTDRPFAVCTMSLHTSMSGLGGEQVLRAYKAIPKGAPVPWVSMGCTDGLGAVLEHYTGRTMDKAARDIFVTGSLQDIISNRVRLLAYGLNDVYEMWHLWSSLWPKFRLHCPSNITIAGLMEASRSMLPVVPDWHDRIAANDAVWMARLNQFEQQLNDLADQAESSGDPGDPWLSQLDWTTAKSGKNKGKPAWYRAARLKKNAKVTLKSNLAPLLLRMKWDGHPLHLDKVKKWGYIADGKFHKLPHKGGPSKNVGSPLSKDFVDLVKGGTLTSSAGDNLAQELANLSYWASYRSRFHGQYVRDLDGFKAIVPVTKLLGTLTGRQVEKTWLTAAMAKPDKLGSDMFHAIQAPKGYKFVGWDEDTEEVRLASLYGDVELGGGVGCTPMSQSAFMGERKKGTDPHTMVAMLAGFGEDGRDDAKVFNFQDIYGGGFNAQANALKANHPEWTDEFIADKVNAMMTAKRGIKHRGTYSGGTDSHYHNAAKAMANAQDFRLTISRRQIPHIINPRYDRDRSFFTSRYNFPTQGAGVDILHLTLALVAYLTEQQGIPGTAWSYVMARHDEVQYCVLDEFAHQFAEIGHSAHAVAWACYFDSLGFNWLPSRAARLVSVNIDWVYRKEVHYAADAGLGLGWSGPKGEAVS